MNYSILIPTRKRPQLLTNLIQSIHDTVEDKNNTEIHIAYDVDDNVTISIIGSLKETYKSIKMDFHGRKRSYLLNDDYYNWMSTNFSEGKYIIAVNDDTKFINYAWDSIALRKIEDYLKDKPDGIFYGITEDKEVEGRRNDSNYFSCFPLISKAGVNALGYFFDPRNRRSGADWDIVIGYKEINRVLDLRNEIIIEHISVRSGRRQSDELDSIISTDPIPVIYINRTEFLTDYILNYKTGKYKDMNMLSINLEHIRNFIIQGYRDILKRDPHPRELEHYANYIYSGGITKDRFLEVLRTSETNLEHIKNFVAQGYRDILKRAPGPEEFGHDVDYIYSGGITKDRFLEVLRTSETNLEHIKNFVAQGYRDILKREPDSGGFEHYINYIYSGGITKDRFLEILRTSEEYKNRFG